MSGANNSSGVALVELYDADTSPTPAGRLVNISVRAQVGTGANVLAAGFVISGNAPETVLIRGVGPGLAQFGITGVLAKPQLDLYQGPTDLLENVGWGGGSPLSTAFAETGAFGLDPASADSAMVVTLQPGSYAAIVSGVNNTTGVALVEVARTYPELGSFGQLRNHREPSPGTSMPPPNRFSLERPFCH